MDIYQKSYQILSLIVVDVVVVVVKVVGICRIVSRGYDLIISLNVDTLVLLYFHVLPLQDQHSSPIIVLYLLLPRDGLKKLIIFIFLTNTANRTEDCTDLRNSGWAPIGMDQVQTTFLTTYIWGTPPPLEGGVLVINETTRCV